MGLQYWRLLASGQGGIKCLFLALPLPLPLPLQDLFVRLFSCARDEMLGKYTTTELYRSGIILCHSGLGPS